MNGYHAGFNSCGQNGGGSDSVKANNNGGTSDVTQAKLKSHAERNYMWERHRIFYIGLTSPEPRTNTSFIDYNLVVCTTKHYNLV